MNRPEKLIYFLNDESKMLADAYSIFHMIMKLGVKQLYINKDIKIIKGRSELEDYGIFFYTKFNPVKHTPFYGRCYRMLALMKELDISFYENLNEKQIEPPILFLYFILTTNRRWLKCFLCREFPLYSVLIIWDSIFANITKESLVMLTDSEYNPLSQMKFFEIESDPLHFLEFFSLTMCNHLRTDCMLV
jgi:hypothetical protein